ncbi:hypothetical protein BGW80DRAFT_1303766 [Lactifluus volemus]|nr:hypothetical protein BGW80DRAFT_1303766 [Lactifluus volemus]
MPDVGQYFQFSENPTSRPTTCCPPCSHPLPFISHTPVVMSHNQDQAKIDLRNGYIAMNICSPIATFRYLTLKISCGEVDRIERLYIQVPSWPSGPNFLVNTDDTQWLPLIHMFTAVQALHISRQFRSLIEDLPALQGPSGESASGVPVLPALVDLYLEGYETIISESLEDFVIARQRSGYPVAIHHWDIGEYE